MQSACSRSNLAKILASYYRTIGYSGIANFVTALRHREM
jgi:hypothetical protein